MKVHAYQDRDPLGRGEWFAYVSNDEGHVVENLGPFATDNEAAAAGVARVSEHLKLRCLACGGRLTPANSSPANDHFHVVCIDEGLRVPLLKAYTDEQLRGTWAERSR